MGSSCACKEDVIRAGEVINMLKEQLKDREELYEKIKEQKEKIKELVEENKRLSLQLAGIREALERRSRMFHAAERERTATFVGFHGSWMGRVCTGWDDCPSAPCADDRRLLAALHATQPAQEVAPKMQEKKLDSQG